MDRNELTNKNEKVIKRVKYFDRQFLTVDEFTVEQNYHLEKYKLHNLMVHSKGIVTNFGLHNATIKDGKLIVQIYGYAIDNDGREIYGYGGYAINNDGREIYIPYGCYVEGIYQYKEDDSKWWIYIKFADLESDPYLYEIDENIILKTRVAEIPTISIKSDGSNATKDEIFIGILEKKVDNAYKLDTTNTKMANSILDDANFHGNVDVDGDLHVNKDISAKSINGNNANFYGNVKVDGDLHVTGEFNKDINAENINAKNANFQGNVNVEENVVVKGNLTVENSISAKSINAEGEIAAESIIARSITANYIARKYVNNSSTSILKVGDVVISKYVQTKFEFPNFPSLPDLPSLSNKKILVTDSDLPELKEKIKNAIELEKMTEKENALIEVGDFLVKAQGISTEIKSEDKKNIGMHLTNHIINNNIDLNTITPDLGTLGTVVGGLSARSEEEICTTSTLSHKGVCGVVVGVEPISKGQIVYIAYSGVCDVKIHPNEVITTGDLLVTSEDPGFACKFIYTDLDGYVRANGAILGKALSDKIDVALDVAPTLFKYTIPVLLMLK